MVRAHHEDDTLLPSSQRPAQNAAQKYSYAPQKKGVSKWIKIGIPLALLVIAGAVVGGIFGARAANNGSNGGSKANDSETKSSWTGSSSGDKPATADGSTLSAASQAAQRGGVDDLTYQGTDLYGNPSFKASATTGTPTSNGMPSDGFAGSTSQLRSHPRIMTTAGQWSSLADKISKDAYLTVWNASIFENATTFFNLPPTAYDIDGGFTGSGVLDPARELQLRIKTFAYAYRMSGNNTRWRDRAWSELQTAAGNNSQVRWGADGDGGSPWNVNHFLDLAEATAAFAIGYDWLYDAWSQEQRDALVRAIVQNGLTYGTYAYNPTDANGGNNYAWWRTTNGNWNCVCNSGLLLGALAIRDVDTSGTAQSIIDSVIPNMKGNCMQGVLSDGTWTETPNYWYFGTAAAARAVSALITATGSDQGLMAANSNFGKTGDFHMAVSGNAGMFFYGDNGPNKYSSNANGMFLFANLTGQPEHALFQRDRADAPDPLSMFWYDPSSKGAFWNGRALDQYFDDPLSGWASMRSSWTDFSGMFVGVKANNLTGHQTHGDLDVGTFVIDALGTRWAGELGNGNYLSREYFASEAPGATRWQYYRKSTEGQNVIVINNQNMNPSCAPVNRFETTGAKQSSAVDYTPGTGDIAYFVSDTSSAYNLSANTISRGIRMLNGRRQVLVQDDISQNGDITQIEWRVHTNATVALSSDRRTATLTLNKAIDPNAYGGNNFGGPATLTANFETKTMIVKLLSPSSATFATGPATRSYGTEPGNQPAGEEADQANGGVTVLSVSLNGGSAQSIQVLWQPQWSNLGTADNATPNSVPLSQWSLTSHS